MRENRTGGRSDSFEDWLIRTDGDEVFSSLGRHGAGSLSWAFYLRLSAAGKPK